MPNNDDILLRVENLKQYFPYKGGGGVTRAVDDVSFDIKKGEVFGLVGESGCGKTTTGRTVIRLYDPTSGNVYFKGQRVSSSKQGASLMINIEKADAKARIAELRAQKAEPARIAAVESALEEKIAHIRKEASESEQDRRNADKVYRERHSLELKQKYEKTFAELDAKLSSASGAERERLATAKADAEHHYKNELEFTKHDTIMTKMQMIFQDPIASINPRMTVREIIAEGLIIRGVRDKKYIDDKVYEMLELVGLVREHAERYPHEFSGGQRQRIGIARAIVLEPELIIADEPISALDVSIQAQVINLLNDLRYKMGLTILFIAHNLSVVKYFSDRIAVMYFGKIVELTTSQELFEHPLHPYTKSLLSAIPYPDPHYEKQRKRLTYTPALAHDYSVDKPSLHEITPGHFIDCNAAELAAYKRELGL